MSLGEEQPLYREPTLTQEIKWEAPYSLGTICVWREYSLGWPLPARRTAEGRDVRWVVKSSLRNLALLVSYYAFRRRQPALTAPATVLPYEDPDLLHVFWMALPHIATPCEAVAALDALASEGLAQGSALASCAAAYALCIGLHAQASPYLGYLGSGTAMELLAAAQGYAAGMRARAAPGSLEAQALQELDNALGCAAAFLDAGLSLGGIPLWGCVPLIQAVQRAAAGAEPAQQQPLPYVEPDPLLDVLRLPTAATPAPASAGSVWAAFSPPALAAALALEDWDLFRSIPLAELLEAGWDSDRYQNTAQACQRFNGRYEALSLWVSAEVLCAGGVREAAAVLVRALAVAGELLALADFSGLFAVCTGLRREEVRRLSSAWALLPPQARAMHERLAALTDDASRNKAYKAVFHAAASPSPRYAQQAAAAGGGGGGAGTPVAGSGAGSSSSSSSSSSTPAIPHLLSICGDATIVAETNKRLVALGEGGPEVLCGVKRARLLLEIWEPVLALQGRSEAGWVPEGTREGGAQLALRAALRPFFFSWSEGPNKDVSERKAAVGRLGALSEALQPSAGGEGR